MFDVGHRMSPFACRMLVSEFSVYQLIVGEDNIASIQFWTVGGLELLHRVGAAVLLVRRFVLENKEMNKTRRIFFLLPCQIHLGAGLVRLDVGEEFLNGALHLVHSRFANSILCNCVDRHCFLSFLANSTSNQKLSVTS